MSSFQTICILGLGYIGLPTAAMFATHGKKVIGVDIDKEIIDTLNGGDIHIHEPGLKDLVQEAMSEGNLKVSVEPSPADAFIIAVPTPFRKELIKTPEGESYRQADLRYVVAATKAIVPHLKPGNLVILESTSPPNTTSGVVQPILEQTGLRAGDDFFLAYSPERVMPGRILHELVNNARVIGGVNRLSAEKGREIYEAFVEGDILLASAVTAEMVKLMENSFRDVNISLANEFAKISEELGVDVWEAIKLANHHPRVQILRPGPGVGGHCIGVDPWFIIEAAFEQSLLLRCARQVNDSQPSFVSCRVRDYLGPREAKIAVFGLTYKENVDDTRESPSIKIARILSEYGYQIEAYDPNIDPDRSAEIGIRIRETYDETIRNAALLLYLVDHYQFKKLEILANCKEKWDKSIFDVTGALDDAKLRSVGIAVFRIGAR